MQVIENTEDEMRTIGLDTLAERCREYYEMGFKFAKWRSTIKIGENLPSEIAVQVIARSLARYGNIC